MTEIYPVEPERVISTLFEYVSKFKAPPGLIPIRWAQFSIVFCTASGISPDTMLSFGQRNYCLSETEDFREYLLFVSHSERTLRICGAIARSRLASIFEMGFITIGDLSLDLVCTSDSFDQLFLNQIKALPSYYLEVPDTVRPSDCFNPFQMEQIFYEEWISIMGADAHGRNPLAQLSIEQLTESFYKTVICQPFKELYKAGLFLAAMNVNLKRAFIAKEVALLKLRLYECYQTERRRMAFVSKFFPKFFKLKELAVAAQYVNRPASIPLSTSTRVESKYTELRNYVSFVYKSAPAPGVAFVVPARYCSAKLVGCLGTTKGKVWLPYQEIVECCAVRLEEILIDQIAQLQRRFSLGLARKYFYQCTFFKNYKTQQLYIKQLHTTLSKIEPDIASLVVHQTERICQDVPFCNYALRLVRDLDGYYDGDAFHPDVQWPARTTHWEGEIESEKIPVLRSELLSYAKQFWPPCMQDMIHQATAMRYTQRLAFSGLLRTFGYSLSQAESLWVLIFEAWDSTAQTDTEAFLASNRGSVVRSDYNKGKLHDIGVSCQYLATAGMCHFKEIDIEDCQKQCGSQLRFPVSSPTNYFTQIRKQIKS